MNYKFYKAIFNEGSYFPSLIKITDYDDTDVDLACDQVNADFVCDGCNLYISRNFIHHQHFDNNESRSTKFVIFMPSNRKYSKTIDLYYEIDIEKMRREFVDSELGQFWSHTKPTKVLVDKIPQNSEECVFSSKINDPCVSPNMYFCHLMPCGGFCDMSPGWSGGGGSCIRLNLDDGDEDAQTHFIIQQMWETRDKSLCQ